VTAGRVALVPGVLALLPEYAGLEDPVADLRAACAAAVAWLTEDVEVVADPQGARVAEHLLAITAVERSGRAGASYLVVGNGTARRSETAPGYLDARAVPFDEALGRALTGPDRAALTGVDQDLARELWASTTTFPRLAELLPDPCTVTVDHDADPFGVQYWVVRWEGPGGDG
jgi:hypothetical protein